MSHASMLNAQRLLREAIAEYYESNVYFVDTMSIIPSKNEDYIDFFISLIFATSNDGDDVVTYDGVVSMYTATHYLSKEGKTIRYNRTHQRSFINKSFKENFLRFINEDVDFELVIRVSNVRTGSSEHVRAGACRKEQTHRLSFKDSFFYKNREEQFAKMLACCKVMHEIC